MKVLLATFSADTATSYGLVTRHLWTRLQKMHPDWEILQHGWVHLPNEIVSSSPWPIESTATTTSEIGEVALLENDKYGRVTLPKIISKFRPDVLWTLSDPFMCDYMGQFRPLHNLALVKHCPIDGTPPPSYWRDAIKDCDLFVPITRFASKAVAPFVDGKVLPWIYHGVDLDVFQPKSQERRKAGLPEAWRKDFILGYVGNNQWRKMTWFIFPLTKYLSHGGYVRCHACNGITLPEWDPVDQVMDSVPSVCKHCGSSSLEEIGPRPVRLWMHTFGREEWNSAELMRQWGLKGRVGKTTMQGRKIRTEDMPAVYNMFDVYLGFSGGEGFCIPIVEAMACGVPVVYNRYSGHGEVGDLGQGNPVNECAVSNVAYISEPGNCINRAVPSLEEAVRAVLNLIDNPVLYRDVASRQLANVQTHFSWDVIADQWSNALLDLMSNRIRTIGGCV